MGQANGAILPACEPIRWRYYRGTQRAHSERTMTQLQCNNTQTAVQTLLTLVPLVSGMLEVGLGPGG